MNVQFCNTKFKVKFRIVDGNGNIIEEQEEDLNIPFNNMDNVGEENEVVFEKRNKMLRSRK